MADNLDTKDPKYFNWIIAGKYAYLHESRVYCWICLPITELKNAWQLSNCIERTCEKCGKKIPAEKSKEDEKQSKLPIYTYEKEDKDLKLLKQIAKFENSTLKGEEILELFCELIKINAHTELGGQYLQQANDFMAAGVITAEGDLIEKEKKADIISAAGA